MSRTLHQSWRSGFICLLLLSAFLTGCHSPETASSPVSDGAAIQMPPPSINTNAVVQAPQVVQDAPTNQIPTQTFCCFKGLNIFSRFTLTNNSDGQVVLISPVIKAAIPWNQLIVSWNVAARPGAAIKVEASVVFTNHASAFYTLALWSPDNQKMKRTSVSGQQDDDGRVDTDTLILPRPTDSVQLRLTLVGSKNGTAPDLKFLGLCFANTELPPLPRIPNERAWGKSVAVPESSQFGYPDENGWCSPAAVSMVMAGWSISEMRPDLLHNVPFVADKVYDDAHHGTGNWPFNTAFAGSYPGMRAYVTRFDDLAEVEDWIAAGIPVILSARWDWLSPGRPPDNEGHLVVCIGFTADGDVVVNDPAAHGNEPVQRIYKRANVIRAWTKSHNAVYLIYPETARIPPNNYGHWETR